MICKICNKQLIGRYLIDEWDNKMCESHLYRDALQCTSCTAFTKREHVLPDGRVLCKDCYNAAMKPEDSIDKTKKLVINALYNVGFNDLRIENINFEIVTAQKLAKIRKEPINLQVKGFTCSTVITSNSLGFFNEKKTSQKFKHNIYMLAYLTKVEFAGMLAHEMLHAWLVQNGVKMSQKMEEGFCNMGTYLIYNSIPGVFSKMLLKSLHESKSPIYGDGFREMFEHFKKMGWNGLIKNVKKKKEYKRYNRNIWHNEICNNF